MQKIETNKDENIRDKDEKKIVQMVFDYYTSLPPNPISIQKWRNLLIGIQRDLNDEGLMGDDFANYSSFSIVTSIHC